KNSFIFQKKLLTLISWSFYNNKRVLVPKTQMSTPHAIFIHTGLLLFPRSIVLARKFRENQRL
ncbi:hypothetical protein CDQ84_14735, partial [Clostridium thermosuccinogenes]